MRFRSTVEKDKKFYKIETTDTWGLWRHKVIIDTTGMGFWKRSRIIGDEIFQNEDFLRKRYNELFRETKVDY